VKKCFYCGKEEEPDELDVQYSRRLYPELNPEGLETVLVCCACMRDIIRRGCASKSAAARAVSVSIRRTQN